LPQIITSTDSKPPIIMETVSQQHRVFTLYGIDSWSWTESKICNDHWPFWSLLWVKKCKKAISQNSYFFPRIVYIVERSF